MNRALAEIRNAAVECLPCCVFGNACEGKGKPLRATFKAGGRNRPAAWEERDLLAACSFIKIRPIQFNQEIFAENNLLNMYRRVGLSDCPGMGWLGHAMCDHRPAADDVCISIARF